MGRLLAQPYRIKVKMMRRLASVSRNAFLSSSSSFHNTTTAFAITGSTANPLLANVQYAVRGEIVIKATDLEKRLKVCLFKQVSSHKLEILIVFNFTERRKITIRQCYLLQHW